MITKIIASLKSRFNNFVMRDDVYCRKCGSCGEDGCCSALKCAYQKMVLDGDGLHCKKSYQDLEFAYEMFHALYEKYPDEEIFDKIWDDVYA